MAGILDMNKFTFCGETIMAINEMVYDEIITAPELGSIHTIFPGIVSKKEVGFIGEGGLVGKKGQGCDPNPHDWDINTRKVIWDPVRWEVLIHACWTDLETTASIYSLKTGVSIPDFTETDYMNIVVSVLADSMKKFIIRLVWFSDVDAANISGGGEITDGLDLDYFNIFDGFFKQMDIQITSNGAQHVTVSENTGASYALQVLDPANVQPYLQKLIFGADLRLRGKSNAQILCTQTFYDAYTMSLQGVQLESMYSNLIAGMRTLTYNGIPLVPMPTWDEMIREFQNTGTKLINPHRAIFTIKDILGVAVDAEGSFSDVEIWYNRDDRKVKLEAMGRADAKLLNPVMFNYAV